MLTAEASTPAPTYRTPAISSIPWMVPSSPHGPCSSGKTTSTSPKRARRLGRLGDDQVGAVHVAGQRDGGAGAVDLGQPVVALDPQPVRLPGLQHPASVGGDADGHDVVRARGRSPASTLPAVTHEMACSLERPPNTTATRGLRVGSFIARRPYGLRWAVMPADPPALARRHRRRLRRPARARAGRSAEHPDHDGVDLRRRAATWSTAATRNPTWTAFEEALGALEGGRCLTFASGLAAVATVLDLVGPGRQGGGAAARLQRRRSMQLADLEARGRVEAVLVDVTDTDAVVAACADAALVWLESPTNPALEVADLPGDHRGRARGRRVRRRRQHLRHPPAAAPARAGRRPGRALGDEVPRRPQRRC